MRIPADSNAPDDIGSSGKLPVDSNSFRIEDLKSSKDYVITFTVFNPAGNFSTETTQSTNGIAISRILIFQQLPNFPLPEAELIRESLLAPIVGSVVSVFILIVVVVVVILILILVLVKQRHRKRVSSPTAPTTRYGGLIFIIY